MFRACSRGVDGLVRRFRKCPGIQLRRQWKIVEDGVKKGSLNCLNLKRIAVGMGSGKLKDKDLKFAV